MTLPLEFGFSSQLLPYSTVVSSNQTFTGHGTDHISSSLAMQFGICDSKFMDHVFTGIVRGARSDLSLFGPSALERPPVAPTHSQTQTTIYVVTKFNTGSGARVTLSVLRLSCSCSVLHGTEIAPFHATATHCVAAVTLL